MCRFVTIPLLLTALAFAQMTPNEGDSKPVRISPSIIEHPKVDAKLLRRGTRVVVHAIITKTGRVSNIEFVKGNADLMPEVRKTLANWRYKPYVYQGRPVEVETTIDVAFDPLTGG
jgi:protein TonB